MWFNLAAAQGNTVARRNRDTVEKQLTREQIADAQRLSIDWKEYREAIRTNPSDARLHFNVASVLFSLRRYEEALLNAGHFIDRWRLP